MKHTPAPWFVSTPGRLDALYVGPVVVSSHRTALGRNASHPELLNHIDDETLYANATLIAAAPELLILLRKAQRLGLDMSIGSAYISRAYITEQTDLNKQIDSLIAKATGSAL